MPFLSLLKPDLQLDSVYQLDLSALRRRGIRGIIFDLDSTLVPWGFSQFDPETLEFLSDLKAKGFKLGFLSNRKGHGRQALRASLDGHPFFFKARKPLRTGFRRLLRTMDLSASEAAVVGDQLFTDILGGKRLGLLTILVQSVDPTREPYLIRLRRWAERWILRSLIHPSD
jgi:HAD superfamily phosphatase (TIGR01668 family)